MDNNELSAWIIKQQIKNDPPLKDPETIEELATKYYKAGIVEGLKMVWIHILKDGEQE